MTIVSILAFIFMLGLVILVHELGHFVFAKRAKILCHEFALGMGPIVYGRKKGETLYSIRAVPIGGFVMMAGEEVGDQLVKVGRDIKVVFDKDEESPDAKITKIILDPNDERYDNAQLITVDFVDLEGKDGGALMINTHEVQRDAYYVMGKKETQIAPHDRSFSSKTIPQRFLTIFAGPFMNFVLAFILFVIVSIVVGIPNYETSEIAAVDETMPAYGQFLPGDVITAIEGSPVAKWADIGTLMRQEQGNRNITFDVLRDGQTVQVTVTPVISFFGLGFSSDRVDIDTVKLGSVGNRTSAAQAGLKVGDIIVSIDGQATATWADVIAIVNANPDGDAMSVVVDRDGVTQTLTLNPLSKEIVESQGVPYIQAQIGIGPVYERQFFTSFVVGFTSIIATMGMIFSTIGGLIRGLVGFSDLGGPVAIYQMTAAVVQDGGFIAFLGFTAFLSINLGIINLLPIPALDGGRLVFLGYEAIFRRPVNRRVENYLHFAMFILLIGLLIFITFNDIIQGW